jgi:DNA polymerase elongation subunit (family B)
MKFKVEDLGIQEIDVYDMGVDNSHNFFGNGLLTHNSNYVCMDEFVSKKMPNGTDAEIVKFLYEKFYSSIDPFIKHSCDELQDYVNAPQQKLVMDMEKILNGMLLTDRKKRYATSVLYKDKVWYDKGKLAVTGLESVKSSTPQFARKFLDDLYMFVLQEPNDKQLKSMLQRQYQSFESMDFDEICNVSSVNTGLENVLAFTDYFPSGTTSQVKACHTHNTYNSSKGYTIQPIQLNGVKIKMLPLKKSNGISKISSNIAYVGDFPIEWKDDIFIQSQIDKEHIWNEWYIRLVDNFISLFGWKYMTTMEDIDFDFF